MSKTFLAAKEFKEAQLQQSIERLKAIREQYPPLQKYNHSAKYLKPATATPPSIPQFRARSARVRRIPGVPPTRDNSPLIQRSKQHSVECRERFLKAFEVAKESGGYIRIRDLLKSAGLGHSYLGKKGSPYAQEARQLVDQWNTQFKPKRRNTAEVLADFEVVFERLKLTREPISFNAINRDLKAGTKWLQGHPELKARVKAWNKSL